jgi:hypothetical protein
MNPTDPLEPPEPSPYECLKTEVDGYIKYSYTWMRVWAAVYYTLRTALIVLASLAAAKDSLAFLRDHLAVLSLLVAIGTSLDTWLKTGNRYKGHYSFNDKFIALYTDLQLTSPTDTGKIQSIHEQFKKMIDDYSTAVLPS